MEGLTIGRIVHYVNAGKHRAAVVTHVWSKEGGTVNLYIFPDGSHPLENLTPTSVRFDETAGEAYTWHWIEKA
jgi:hypothetical protein